MKALILTTAEHTARVEEVPKPVPGSSELLIKVHAVALNPVDALYVACPLAAQPNGSLGWILQISSWASVMTFRPRLTRGRRWELEWQASCNEVRSQSTSPRSMSLEEASTIPTCGMTAAQGLFFRLGVPCPFWPTPEAPQSKLGRPLNVFVYGASSSLGLFAGQLANLVKQHSQVPIRLLGAARDSHHQMLKEHPYSFDALFDYRQDDWPEQVTKFTDGTGVDFVMDCISEESTVEMSSRTLNPTGKCAVFRPPKNNYDPDKLPTRLIYGAAYEAFGVATDYGAFTFPVVPDAREFAAAFYQYLTDSGRAGQIKLRGNPVRLMPGGLDHIAPDGLSILGAGVLGHLMNGKQHGRTETYMRPISAEKPVYNIS
ncbi:Uu.00g037350.m01.CDS01 [Anthostomella pinea]|uniref:Uu.00g037350.m01.CDS01 n=1 Tax=Anthostomella pinea TaxID=933095 RepID=A0AAI8YDM9_9PEZI|nr:Uu.00g037350.m01.CDS01 [Anthostomella pinea]